MKYILLLLLIITSHLQAVTLSDPQRLLNEKVKTIVEEKLKTVIVSEPKNHYQSHEWVLHEIEGKSNHALLSLSLYSDYFILLEKTDTGYQVVDANGLKTQNHLFDFSTFVKFNKTQKYYLLQSNLEIFYQTKIVTVSELDKIKQIITAVVLLSTGGMLFLFIYILFFYLTFNRDKLYFYYLVYLLSFIFFTSCTSGIIIDLLRYYHEGGKIFFVQPIIGGIAIIAFKIFSDLFLGVDQSKRSYRISNYVIAIIVVCVTLMPFTYEIPAAIFNMSNLYLVVYCLINAGKIYYKTRQKSAGFYLFSWTTHIAVVFYYITYFMFLIPYSHFLKYGALLSATFEIVLLAMALGLKMKEKEKQTEAEKTKLIHQMSNILSFLREPTVEEMNRPINEIIESNIKEINKQNKAFKFILEHSDHHFYSINRQLKVKDLSEAMSTTALQFNNFFENFMDEKNALEYKNLIPGLLGENKLTYEVNSHLLRDEFNLNGNYYLILWFPIVIDNRVEELLLSVTNLTYRDEHKRLEQEHVERYNFITKINNNMNYLTQLTKDFENLSSLSPVALHTLKGNLRQLGLTQLSSLIHLIEEKEVAAIKKEDLIHSATNLWNQTLKWIKPLVAQKESFQTEQIINLLSLPSVELKEKIANYFNLSLVSYLCQNDSFVSNTKQMAKSLHKKVDFNFEIKKTYFNYGEVLMKIRDAVNHVVVNCVDHGIEESSVRVQKNKNEIGIITMTIDGNTMTVYDDGQGINREVIKSKAKRLGLISGDEMLSDEDVIRLLTSEGFSSRDTVSVYSGRGVGLAAVKKVLEDIGGELNIQLNGNQLIFTMQLPAGINIS